MAEQVKTDVKAVDLRGCYPLARLRWIIRGYVLVEGIFLALILGCLWFWFSTALDFGLQHFFGIDLLDSAPLTRYAIMTVFAAAITSIVVWYIFRRLFRDFRPESLALVLEKRFPDLLGDRLITAVELYNLKQAESQGYSVEMIVKTMQDAKERVAKVPVRTVFNWRRLALLAWTLVGVSALILLLAYPVCVLVSLVDRAPERATWMMLSINALVVALLLFAFVVPYMFIGLRRGNIALRWVTLAVGVLCAVGAGIGYKYALRDVNAMKMHEYSWRFYHATDIGTERNFLFGQTRWPRDEHFVAWFDFPVDEKRIQFNKTINARALFTTWIVADTSRPEGWRPLLWKDLPKVVDKDAIPQLPLDAVNEYVMSLVAGDERSPVGYDKSKVALPAADDVTVDLVIAAASSPEGLGLPPAEQRKFAELATLLRAKATDPKLGGRVIREVPPPGELTLVYGSDTSKLRGRSRLAPTDSRRNVFGLEQPVQLNDSFVTAEQKQADSAGAPSEKRVPLIAEGSVNGKLLKTEPKNVVLVTAPKVQQIVYQEFRPAYYYYLPPSGPRAGTVDERRALLKGFRQALAKMPFASPPDSFTLPDFTVGSEVTFTATADKPLQEVTLTPRGVDFPGALNKDEIAPVKLPIAADGRSFTVKFGEKGLPLSDLLAGKAVAGEPLFPLITKPITFDLTLKDADNMVSSRSISARPIEDKPPTVNLFVDVIRQVKIDNATVYMCTARADIPFSRDSVIADETGLHKIDFSYEYSPIVSSAYQGGMAEQVAWLFNGLPVMPNLGDYVARREILARTLPQIQATIERDMPEAIRRVPPTGHIPIPAFDNLQGTLAERAVLSVDELTKRVKEPLPSDYVSPVLKKLTLKDLETPLTFDVERLLPQLREKNSANLVPNYKLLLDIRATDSNVAGDAPRTARNAETLEFRIVGTDELYGYIAKEEAELVRRFGEMIQKLEDQQKILQGAVTRVPSLSPSTASFEQTRLEGVMDAVSGSRVTLAEVLTSYERIQREYAVNRFPEKLSVELDKKIVTPMRGVQGKEFPNADKELSQFHAVLKSGRPDVAQPTAIVANQAFIELLEALRRIQKEMGDTIGFNKIVLRLQKIAEGQNLLSSDDIAKLRKDLEDKLLRIQFVPAPDAVTIDAGKTAETNLKLLMPTTITVDPLLRFEIPANSGLQINPKEVPLADDAKEAKFTITAGAAKGTFFVKVIPSQGNPIDLKVVVK